jgi:anti-anti-sigma factor
MMSTQELFSTHTENQALVVMPLDKTDSLTSHSYVEEAEGLLNELRKSQLTYLIVDFEKVEYFGTYMLEIMLALRNQVQASREKMLLCNVPDVGREVLRVTKLDTLLPIYASRHDALHAINAATDSIQGRLAVTLVVVTALGSLTLGAAQESKDAGGKKQITNSIGMKLVLIPAGEFKMGSGESTEATAAFFNKAYGKDFLTAGFFKDEHPQHRVRITKPFYLGTYHVTRGQFRQFVAATACKTDAEKGERPGAFGWEPGKKECGFNEKYSWRNVGFEQTDEHPVVNVSWNDAVAFCKWLSRKEGETYRLPTEAEWEYACRAGTTTRYYSGDDPETLAKVGNVADAAAKAKFPNWTWTIKATDGYVFTAPVGKFKPNAFGLYDMHGNAWQWCADWYGAEYYAASPVDDPTGPDSGPGRVLRGGSWDDRPGGARSAKRVRVPPDDRGSDVGFRVARTQ